VKVSKISGRKKRTNVEGTQPMGTGGYPPSDVYMQGNHSKITADQYQEQYFE
jgi:hypothetical protein|tara:strand:- start:295 stop:450 length:156 start_codon:yes stop_codon:yes gene_type:complete